MTGHIFKKTSLALFLLCLTAGLWSCSTQRGGGRKKEAQLLQQAVHETQQSRWLDTRWSVETAGVRLKGQLKVIADSCVWLSAQFFGMEAARVFITPEETKILMPMMKQYCSLDDLPEAQGLSSGLQAILLHRIHIPGKEEATLDDFTVEKDDAGGWKLSRDESFGHLCYHFDKDLQFVRTEAELSGQAVNVDYSGFDDGGFPTTLRLETPADGKSIVLTYTRPDRDTRPDIKMNVPATYTPVPLAGVLKSIGL